MRDPAAFGRLCVETTTQHQALKTG